MSAGVVGACALVGALVASATMARTRLIMGPDLRELREALGRANDAARAFERRAGHDPLTGLANRAMFLEHLEHALAGVAADGTTVAVLFLDLDRFKIVNDSLGHQAGDRLLCVIADRLRGQVRSSDVVARLGGDEFVILVTQLDEPSPAISLAERLIAVIEAPVLLDGTAGSVSTSIGIAIASPGISAESPESLVRNADMAMYRAKRAGAGGYEVFDAEMRRLLTARQAMERSFRDTVERGDLEAVYQPVVNVATGLIWGCEATMRWTRPGLDTVDGDGVSSLAESLGLATILGRQLVVEACNQTAAWRRRWPSRHLNLVIRLTGTQLADAHIVETIVDALGDGPVPRGTDA